MRTEFHWKRRENWEVHVHVEEANTESVEDLKPDRSGDGRVLGHGAENAGGHDENSPSRPQLRSIALGDVDAESCNHCDRRNAEGDSEEVDPRCGGTCVFACLVVDGQIILVEVSLDDSEATIAYRAGLDAASKG